jgi:colicin import membrane protein
MVPSTTASGVKPGKQEANNGTEERLPKWVLASLFVHGVLITVLFSTSFWPPINREPPPSYVVDLVGGERIGGRNSGTSIVSESKKKPVPAERPPPAKTVSSAKSVEPLEKKSVEPIEKKRRKAEKTPEKAPEKTLKVEREKIKSKPGEEVAVAKPKMQAKQEKQKTEAVAKPVTKEAQDDATSDEEALEKVRERVIQAAIERARSRAAVRAQGSPTIASNAKSDDGDPLSAGSGEGLGAQSLGKGGVGGEGVLKSVEYIRYVNYMQATLKGNWAWAGPQRSLKALVRFSVKENGEIVGVKIVQSSGDPLYDESVIRAVKKSSPLTAPPENHRKDFADVEYSFQPGQVG